MRLDASCFFPFNRVTKNILVSIAAIVVVIFVFAVTFPHLIHFKGDAERYLQHFKPNNFFFRSLLKLKHFNMLHAYVFTYVFGYRHVQHTRKGCIGFEQNILFFFVSLISPHHSIIRDAKLQNVCIRL